MAAQPASGRAAVGRRRVRLALLGGAMLTLAACATTGEPGGGVAIGGMPGGMTNPLAGLWGRMPVVGNPDAASGAGGSGAPAVVDPFAGQGVSQPDIPTGGNVKPAATPKAATTSPTPPTPAAGSRPAAPAPANPASHTVASGETAWSIARKYGVSIKALAEANKLPADTMTVRVGQKLAIPAGGTSASGGASVTAPGSGSPTPEPPSASKPLPREGTVPASTPVAKPESPDLGATRTKASGNGKFQMPVAGSIVRTYAKGRNEGIDISAPGGTTVKAAGSGTVAAITRDTEGVPIVVVRHQDQLMTVYSGLGALKVAKGDKVAAGDALGTSGKSGVLHFEVRQGFDSVDPERYLR